MKRPSMQLSALVLDCGDAAELADFYRRLLGWEYTHPAGNGGAAITAPDGMVMAFQEVEGYRPPVWPWTDGGQGQMLHFDLRVESLEQAVQFAISCGARLADAQYFHTSRTMLDPAGHPFCLDTYQPEPGC